MRENAGGGEVNLRSQFVVCELLADVKKVLDLELVTENERENLLLLGGEC